LPEEEKNDEECCEDLMGDNNGKISESAAQRKRHREENDR